MKKLEEFEIIDIHNHVFPEKIAMRAASNIRDYYKLPMEGDGTLATMKRLSGPLNIKKYVICSAATHSDKVGVADDFIHNTVLSDNQLVGLGTTHADFKDFDREVERILEFGLRGIKIHSEFQGFAIDDPGLDSSYRLIEKYKLPVLFHLGDKTSDLSSAVRLRRVMDKYPDMIVIAAHMGGHVQKEAAEKYLVGQNVYFDNSEWQYTMTAQEMCDMTRRHGVDKVMFGSDYPLNTALTCAKRFYDAPFTDEEKELIFSKNAMKVFHID